MKKFYKCGVALLTLLIVLTAVLALPLSATEAREVQTGLAGERLDEQSQKVYLLFKERAEEIASGQTHDAYFTVDATVLNEWGIKTAWTKEELGVPALEDSHSGTVNVLFWEQIDLASAMDALLHDCPFEMFWFDKTVGLRQSCRLSMTGKNGIYDTLTVTELFFCMTVSADYRSSSYDPNAPTVDAASVAAAYQTLENAREIVTRCKDRSDYEKLLAYCEEICKLTAYNDDAASPSYQASYGNPWQAPYVFDGNDATGVVCEGYAKAFQLLCDLTTFRSDVRCYTVTGLMQGGKGAGNHMWNIVSIGGDHYLVDVTNTDTGTVGEGGALFLAGYSVANETGFGFETGSGIITYFYDNDSMALWGSDSSSVLMISEKSFEPTDIQVVSTRPLVYTGQALTVGASDADLIYSCVGGDNLNDGYLWSFEWYEGETGIPAPVDAGTYILRVTATSKTDLFDYTQKQFEITVEKAIPTYEIPQNLEATYGDQLSSVTLDSGFAWKTPDVSVGAVGTMTATVIYTPIDTKNYQSVELEVGITVKKAIPTYTVPTGLTATYGERLEEVLLPGGFRWQNSGDTRIQSIGENIFLATYIPEDTESYLAVSDIAVTLSVSPRDIADAEVVLGDAPIYNGEEQTQAVVGVRIDGLDVTFTVSGNTAASIGVYTLTLTGTGNFTGTLSVPWRISPDLSGLNALSAKNVKTSDRETIEEIVAALAEQGSGWEDVLEKCEALIAKLDAIEQEVDDVLEAAGAMNRESISASDRSRIEEVLGRLTRLADGDNLTQEEKKPLLEAKAELEGCLEKIDEEQMNLLLLVGGGVAFLILIVVTISIIASKKKKR